MFWVVGGIYTDSSFAQLEKGSAPECYGPFATEWEANRVHQERSRRSIDICWHRLYVVRN